MTLRDFAREAALRVPQVRALQVHAATLAQERDRATGQAQALAAERDQLADEARRLAEELDRLAEERDRLSDEARQKDAERDRMVQDTRTSEAARGKMETELAATRSTLQQSNADRQRLEDRLTTLQHARQSLETSLAAAAGESRRGAAQAEHLQTEAQRARTEAQALRTALDAAEAERAQLRAEAEASEAAREALELRLYMIGSGVQRAAVLNDALMTDMRAAHDELRGVVEENTRAAHAHDALIGELDALQLRLLAADGELHRAAMSNEALSGELGSSREQLDVRAAEWDRLRAALERELSVLRTSYEALSSYSADLQNNQEVLQNALAEQSAAYAAERAVTDREIARLGEGDQRSRRLADDVAQANLRVALLEQEGERLRNEERRLVQARAELEELRGRLAVMEHEAERARTQETALVDARAQLSAREAELVLLRQETVPLSVATDQIANQIAILTGATARAAQLTDVRDRLSSRLQIIGYDVDALRRGLSRGEDDGTGASRMLYLDLLESALTGELFQDPTMAPWQEGDFDADRRLYGRDWPRSATTMIGTARMRNLRELTEVVLREQVEGDLLEAGVWRGGACIYMRGVLAAYGDADRRVWVADSFAGLPPPNVKRYPADRGDEHHTVTELVVPLDEVRSSFERFGLLDEQVAFLPGWFKDTLPSAPLDKLAILRLDGDMYGSTIETLEALYAKVSQGGFVIVDDYILPACRRAVDDYRAQHRIAAPLQDVDGAAVYWRK